jgi:hypothetical protein
MWNGTALILKAGLRAFEAEQRAHRQVAADAYRIPRRRAMKP